MSALVYTSILSLLASVTGNGRNSQDSPIGGPITLTTSPASVRQIALAGGNNSVPIDAGTQYLIIYVPGSANVKFAKAVLGDSGWQFNTGPLFLDVKSLNGNPGSFYINSTGSETITIFEY